MRRVNVRPLESNAARTVLLSLNRFFYILSPLEAQGTTPQGYKVASKIEREAALHFEVFEEQDWLVQTDESNKFVNFYSLRETLNASPGTFPQIKHQQ